ncbi:MAG: NAD(P)H-dependent glycerol-3-phosphate dehydrogenase [Acidimicrobiales bacterium]|nr:NAD(P)H-dependent glycerol-3-phosphate dehydrogenase [Acidimicrobiales bacterium]
MNIRVVVLGAGTWGTTMATLASRNAGTVLWARRPEVVDEVNTTRRNAHYLPGVALSDTLRATASLEEAVAGADVVVMAVPSYAFRQVLEAAALYVRPWVPVISLAKGFEQGTNLRMTEVINEVLPGHPAGVLTGPNLAQEIVAGHAAASVVAMREPHVAEVLQRVFASDLFRVYTNSDVVGCEVAGPLKNVIAIASGIADGLETGDSTRAAVITRGVAELTRFGVAMGGRPETFAGLAGMGDLIATCINPESRNRWFGEQLGRGRPLAEVRAGLGYAVEGVHAAGVIMQLAAQHGLDLPICAEMDAVLNRGRSPHEAYRGLLRRSANPAVLSR